MKHQIVLVLSCVTGLENLVYAMYIRPHVHSMTLKISEGPSAGAVREYAQTLKRCLECLQNSSVVIEDYLGL